MTNKNNKHIGAIVDLGSIKNSMTVKDLNLHSKEIRVQKQAFKDRSNKNPATKAYNKIDKSVTNLLELQLGTLTYGFEENSNSPLTTNSGSKGYVQFVHNPIYSQDTLSKKVESFSSRTNDLENYKFVVLNSTVSIKLQQGYQFVYDQFGETTELSPVLHFEYKDDSYNEILQLGEDFNINPEAEELYKAAIKDSQYAMKKSTFAYAHQCKQMKLTDENQAQKICVSENSDATDSDEAIKIANCIMLFKLTKTPGYCSPLNEANSNTENDHTHPLGEFPEGGGEF